jgi:hypothetical protein
MLLLWEYHLSKCMGNLSIGLNWSGFINQSNDLHSLIKLIIKKISIDIESITKR